MAVCVCRSTNDIFIQIKITSRVTHGFTTFKRWVSDLLDILDGSLIMSSHFVSFCLISSHIWFWWIGFYGRHHNNRILINRWRNLSFDINIDPTKKWKSYFSENLGPKLSSKSVKNYDLPGTAICIIYGNGDDVVGAYNLVILVTCLFLNQFSRKNYQNLRLYNTISSFLVLRPLWRDVISDKRILINLWRHRPHKNVINIFQKI